MRQSDWTIQNVVESYVENGKLSRRQTAFLIQELERMCESEVDYTANWESPPMNTQTILGGNEYRNCSWAHLACHVLAELEIETQSFYPYEAPTEELGAIPASLTPEREAELKAMEEEWNALSDEERQRLVLEAAKRI
jgi:hypothetical protein